MTRRDPPEHLIVGRIRKPHGVRGEIAVTPITDAPDVVFTSGRRLLLGTPAGDPDPGHPDVVIASARPTKDGWLLRFRDVDDRTTAERWRERFLLARTNELPPPAEDELYQHELVGMMVEHVNGEALGTVSGLYELPQGLLLEVARPDGGSALVPWRDEIVLGVDVEERRLVVDPPEGLL